MERIGRSLDLVKVGIGDRTTSANDAVARARQHVRVAIDRPSALLELSDEAVMYAVEVRTLGLSEVKGGKQPPKPHRCVANKGLVDFLKHSHETGKKLSRKK